MPMKPEADVDLEKKVAKHWNETGSSRHEVDNHQLGHTEVTDGDCAECCHAENHQGQEVHVVVVAES